MALKLTVSQEWADGITDFLHVDTDSQKLTVSQKWTDGINWFLLAGTNHESWFNNFWLGMVKNGHGLLVHETLRPTAS